MHAVASVLEMPEGREVCVIGTLYKEMKLKPSILNDYTKVPPFNLPNLSTLHVECHLVYSSINGAGDFHACCESLCLPPQ